jgi:hypothetical protein
MYFALLLHFLQIARQIDSVYLLLYCHVLYCHTNLHLLLFRYHCLRLYYCKPHCYETLIRTNKLNNHMSQGRSMSSKDVKPETVCGYCSQGKHYQCRGYDCECARTGHSSNLTRSRNNSQLLIISLFFIVIF